MSRSNDAGRYFQTTDALATCARKAAKSTNKRGDPIQLPSKLLDAIGGLEPGKYMYVAEAAGEIKRVELQNGSVKRIFSAPRAPLTSLALCPHTNTLFAGSWDRNIYAVPLDPHGDRHAAARVRTFHLGGHTDFVKCLLATRLVDRDGAARPVLLSGGADAVIIVWDMATGRRLHRLQGHTKALAHLAIDPSTTHGGGGDAFTLFSASSDREIRRWHVSLGGARQLAESVAAPLRAHETSVARLVFAGGGAELWTASADTTAKRLVRGRDFAPDTTLAHPDFVRDVVVWEARGLVVTACRDEHVRVWEAGSGRLLQLYEGHFEEVTRLVMDEARGRVWSVGIDGTVRRWGLCGEDFASYREAVEREGMGGDEGRGESAGGGSLLTQEEEDELAELMGSDE